MLTAAPKLYSQRRFAEHDRHGGRGESGVISKIRKVVTFRSFKNWTWPTGLSPFRDINLIYGINGSGKSTFSSLLRRASGDSAWSSGLDVEVMEHGLPTRSVDLPSDPIWGTIKVFNRDYVDEYLSFEGEAGGAAQPLLVLGKENVEREEQRKKCEAEIKRLEGELPPIDKDARKLAKALADLLRKRARLIASELGSLGGRYAERSYDAGTLKRELGSPTATDVISNEEVTQQLAIVQEQPLAVQDLPGDMKLSMKSLLPRIEAALRETPASKAIAVLADNPRWQSWVETGLELHEHLDGCIFCGGPVTADRRSELVAHFDESMRSLQEELLRLDEDLKRAKSRSTEVIQELPKPAELFKSLRSDYKAKSDVAKKQQKDFSASIDELAIELEAKLKAMFTSTELKKRPEFEDIDFNDIGKVIEKHNEMSKNLEGERSKAARKVEVARVHEIRDSFTAISDEIDSTESKHKANDIDLKKSKLELAGLSSGSFDAQPLAHKLNGDLSRLIGRDELKFIVDDGGYRITRSGGPAHHLSEGERNAISLLYFLCSLGTHDTASGESIVIVDDPVSSLDGNALAGASAHFWSELVGKGKC